MTPIRPIIGVSLKMHLGYRETVQWLEGLRNLASPSGNRLDVETFVLPSFVAIADAQRILRGSGIGYGAQDTFWEARGAYTGEVSAEVIRELGGSYVEVGHAERRRLFAEDDAIIARKAAAAVAATMTPVLCIGEPHDAGLEPATRACRKQLGAVLDAIPHNARLIVAYEPVWAIGAAQPAALDHIHAVVDDIRMFAGRPAKQLSVIYGGSAGPGLLSELIGVVDGLFLGRAALHPARLRAVFSEARQLSAADSLANSESTI